MGRLVTKMLVLPALYKNEMSISAGIGFQFIQGLLG
jgi:hypothetical protein